MIQDEAGMKGTHLFSLPSMMLNRSLLGPKKVFKEQFISGSSSKTNVLDFVS